MEYSTSQLKLIQRRLKRCFDRMSDTDGFGKMIAYSDLAAWASHAALAWYTLDNCYRMYKQEGNIRTYLEV